MISVEHTQDFDRVAELPRRALTIETACEWALALTPVFALVSGAELRPWQAQALADAVACNGAWLALPVGQGKTLLSWLLPTALRATRTVLIVPASLLAKTESDFAAFRGVWRAPPPIRFMTRELLAVEKHRDDLEAYAPDLIVIDESDDLSRAGASAPRRIDRYVLAHPEVRVVCMSGTPARKSLLGYWHQLCWCLRGKAPVPMSNDEARNWALAIDEFRGEHASPGPLGNTTRAARAWFAARLRETPGVVIVDEDSCDAPLTIRIRIAGESDALNAAFERFGVEMENPGGIPVSDPLSRWLLDGQLGLGLYTRWNPPPPEAWRLARRNVARFVRERIAATTHAARPLDTEAQVLRRYAHHEIVAAWLAIKDTFKGTTEPVWISNRTIEDCLAWLDEDPAPGIMWCGSVEFARELAARAGLAYYGARGQTSDGEELHAAPTNRSLVASWNANKKGFNLQPWRRQLITMPPQSAKWLEQIFGRSHRAGQREPVVVDVLATSGGTLDAFDAAIDEAAAVRATVSMTHKLLRATIERAEPDINDANAFRWARRT